ncbi:MAG: reactive intermediate/imine deaminase [Gammaproteobacteria bacterium]|nr:reactive intermediate/imine deaminase [Gammaproteobacteria bacterium]|tara:strand:- start:3291 stop:3665 length:375 start_codon:yes stop_codon:yes gene_type:complete
MKIIETENAPKAIGTYSQAVKVNGFLFISGQIPLNPSTMELVEGIENQINQVFENIHQILKADGMDFSNVVKLSVLLEDLSHFEKVNEIMANIFSKPYPARAAYEVSKLPKGSSVEIETIAFKE